MSDEIVRYSDPDGWARAERRASFYQDWIARYDAKGVIARWFMATRDSYVPSVMRHWAEQPVLAHYDFLRSSEYGETISLLKAIGWRR